MSMFSESLRAFLRPVLEYLDDPSVSEIMINGPHDVWIERGGLLQATPVRFSEDGLMAAARNMAQFVGRKLDDQRPRLDARLPDGSRIHVLLPPMARCGTVISIRKFHPGGLSVDQLIELGAATREAARFLEATVIAKRNMVVAGGTGSGKTTLLNVLSHFIPDEERILTLEDSAELQLSQQHLVPLESRPADQHGRNAVTIRDLLHSALRLRPDRIVVGEVRGGECFDLLQAMNTGHGGMLSTVHANSSIETLSRLESLALLADVGLPLRALRAQVASAVDLVVCTGRLRDGSRRITAISEVLPLDERGDYRVQDLFVFTQTRAERAARVRGYFAPTGVLPTFLQKLVADGFDDLEPTFFDPRRYGYPVPPVFLGTASVEVMGARVRQAHGAQGLHAQRQRMESRFTHAVTVTGESAAPLEELIPSDSYMEVETETEDGRIDPYDYSQPRAELPREKTHFVRPSEIDGDRHRPGRPDPSELALPDDKTDPSMDIEALETGQHS